MPTYRHRFRPGSSYFFTLNLADRRSDLLTRHASLLGQSARDVEGLYPFETIAAVILPDHMHMIWTLPDRDHQTRIRAIKAGFTARLADATNTRESALQSLWQRSYWDYRIRDVADFSKHIAYIHGNPVKHGLVADPDEWRHSTWHRFKSDEILNWSPDPLVTSGET